MNEKAKEVFAAIYELIGIGAIVSVTFLPNKKTIIDTILMKLYMEQTYIGRFGMATLIMAIVFVVIYSTAFRFFAKEKSTKIFSICSTVFMILTLASAMIFR